MSNKSMVAGVVNIATGAFGLLGTILIIILILNARSIFGDPASFDPPRSPAEIDQFVQVTTTVFGFMAFGTFALSLLGIFGGIQAIRRKTWGLVLAASIAGTIIFFPLGVIAIVFTSLAKSEFNKASQTSALVQEELNQVRNGTKHKTAGILTIVAGVFGVLMLLYYIWLFQFADIYQPPSVNADFYSTFKGVYLVGAIVYPLLGAFGIMGGIFARKGTHWGLALAGAIAGCVTFFPLGIPAVLLTAQSRLEFNTGIDSTSIEE